ncbi:hypothetical protein [Clostridium chrysemydis]|uniref:hypothetical protein n=1 Tax=Clostridium chrysemydis TaxID=2665504 RepID=UPI001883E929|nr:hypothetical protein [Clostridium chrysemydis]
MKFLKNSYKIIIFLVFIFITLVLINKFLTNNSEKSTMSSYSLEEKDYKVNLDGDNHTETLKVSKTSKGFNLILIDKDKEISLGSLDNDEFLVDTLDFSSINILNLSRNSKNQILITGVKNNNNVTYLFGYLENELKLIYKDDINVVYLKDYNSNKSPQFITFHFYNNVTPFNSYYLINDNFYDVTKTNLTKFNFNSLYELINIISLDYDLESVPDIFDSSTDSNEISPLWKLDKDSYSYTFQNAIIKDDSFSYNQSLETVEAYLNFSKKNKTNNSVSSLKLKVILKKNIDDNFKVLSLNTFKK